MEAPNKESLVMKLVILLEKVHPISDETYKRYKKELPLLDKLNILLTRFPRESTIVKHLELFQNQLCIDMIKEFSTQDDETIKAGIRMYGWRDRRTAEICSRMLEYGTIKSCLSELNNKNSKLKKYYTGKMFA